MIIIYFQQKRVNRVIVGIVPFKKKLKNTSSIQNVCIFDMLTYYKSTANRLGTHSNIIMSGGIERLNAKIIFWYLTNLYPRFDVKYDNIIVYYNCIPILFRVGYR